MSILLENNKHLNVRLLDICFLSAESGVGQKTAADLSKAVVKAVKVWFLFPLVFIVLCVLIT